MVHVREENTKPVLVIARALCCSLRTLFCCSWLVVAFDDGDGDDEDVENRHNQQQQQHRTYHMHLCKIIITVDKPIHCPKTWFALLRWPALPVALRTLCNAYKN